MAQIRVKIIFDGMPLTLKLSHQKGKGYKKSIGFHIGRDGTRKPKMFWLGPDKTVAAHLAAVLAGLWERCHRVDHRDVWWEGDPLEIAAESAKLEDHRRLVRQAATAVLDDPRRLLAFSGELVPAEDVADQSTLHAPQTPAPPPGLHAAIADFEKHIDARVPHQLSCALGKPHL